MYTLDIKGTGYLRHLRGERTIHEQQYNRQITIAGSFFLSVRGKMTETQSAWLFDRSHV